MNDSPSPDPVLLLASWSAHHREPLQDAWSYFPHRNIVSGELLVWAVPFYPEVQTEPYIGEAMPVGDFELQLTACELQTVMQALGPIL